MVEDRAETQNSSLKLPKDFKFGTATAPFQVEGNVSGERKTDWDLFLERHPGIVKPGEVGPNWWTPGEAEADFRRMKELGMHTQRLGFEWGRIEPEKGKIAGEAIQRYRRMIDYLKQLGIEPMVTLNHFSLPAWVAGEGGWAGKESRRAFIRYAGLIANEFGDVPYWITINEPDVIVKLGYFMGSWPPEKKDSKAALVARHNLIEAHNEAYDLLKKANPKSQVGSSHNVMWFKPNKPDSPINRSYVDLWNYIFSTNWISATRGHTDFTGVNFFTGYHLNFNPRKLAITIREDAKGTVQDLYFGETVKPDADTSDMGWPIVPDFFLDALHYLHKEFGKPIIITENGVADQEDAHRSLYILTHLVALWKAIQEGVDVRAYTHWSTIDNLEWVDGYNQRFGLIGLDPKTGERTIRRSAALYGEIATSGEIDVDGLADRYLTGEQRKKAQQIIEKILKDPSS